MYKQELRQTQRVACSFPVQLTLPGRWVMAQAVDLSRTGVRLVLSPEKLGIGDQSTLVGLTRELGALFPSAFPACFHPELLGPLVQRSLQVMRVGAEIGEAPSVEIGCQLDVPFEDADAAALGLELPGTGASNEEAEAHAVGGTEGVDDVLPRPPARQDHAAAAREADEVGAEPSDSAAPAAAAEIDQAPVRFAAQVTPTTSALCTVMAGWTEEVDLDGISVLVPKDGALALATDAGHGVAGLLAAFCEIFGSVFDLHLLDHATEVWEGQARIRSVEVLPNDLNSIILGFAYVQELSAAERAALSLPSEVGDVQDCAVSTPVQE